MVGAVATVGGDTSASPHVASAGVLSPRNSRAPAGAGQSTKFLGATLGNNCLKSSPGLVTILGRHLTSPVGDPEPVIPGPPVATFATAATAAAAAAAAAATTETKPRPTLVRHDTLPLNEAELVEQATYEGMIFTPLPSATLGSSLPGADNDRARVLKRTATQEEREQDPSSRVIESSAMPDRSRFLLQGHLKRRDTDPYVLSQLKREGAAPCTETV
jgi:hypothetical protein